MKMLKGYAVDKVMILLFQMPWELFPPLFWAVLIPILVAVGGFVLWDLGPGISRRIWAVLKWLKGRLWRKQVMVPCLVLLSLVAWRAWPLAYIVTGVNMKSSKDFTSLEEYLPPEKSPVKIYEGLSHSFFEKDQLIDEILLGSRKIIHGHGFRLNAIEPNEVTQAVVAELWSGKIFLPWCGEKMCGGFHADYCLCWEDEGASYDLMICLGCGEALLFRDGAALRCDLQHDFSDRLRDLAYPKSED